MGRQRNTTAAGNAGVLLLPLLALPWLLGYAVPGVRYVTCGAVALLAVGSVASPRFFGFVKTMGGPAAYGVAWLALGTIHGASLRADADSDEAAERAREEVVAARAGREAEARERARIAEVRARQAVIEQELARPLADRVTELGALLVAVPREAPLPRPTFCYASTLVEDGAYAQLSPEVRRTFEHTLDARRAQELARMRRDDEAMREVVCRDGSGSDCLCHDSHQGCCSRHGGVAGCERLEPPHIVCEVSPPAAERFLVESNRIRSAVP